MKKQLWIPILIIIIIVIGIILIVQNDKSNQINESKEPIKIGVVADLSGSLSVYGNYLKNGLDLALDEINLAGGVNGRRLELVYEDSKSETHEAVTAVNKLININKIQIIFGVSSNAILAMSPITEQAEVILFAPIASAADITNAGDYVFRNRESGSLHGRKMAEFTLNQLNIKNVAIIAINADNGLSYQNGFNNEFERIGGKVLGIDNYVKGENDFRSILTKIKEKNPEAVYLAGYVKEMAQIIRQSEELEIKTQFLASVGIESEELFEIIESPMGDGLIYTYPSFNPDSPDISGYQKKHEDRYNSKSEALTANSYDALKILSLTLKECETDTACIKDELYKIKNYEGVGGLTSFDENGDVIKPIIFKTIKNGEFVPYEE